MNHKRVARLMSLHGIVGTARRRKWRTTKRDRNARPSPDLVERNFEAHGPDRPWVAGITYVPTWSGFASGVTMAIAGAERAARTSWEGRITSCFILLAVVITGCTFGRPTDTESARVAAPTAPRYRSTYYPVPTYLPAGFQLVAVFTDRPDGFRGGSSEVTLWYGHRDHPQRLREPMGIFIAPTPDGVFQEMNRDPETVMLTMGDGTHISAAYYNGYWTADRNGERVDEAGRRSTWRTDGWHTLSFGWRGMAIAVMGSRITNVTYEELLRIAQSFE